MANNVKLLKRNLIHLQKTGGAVMAELRTTHNKLFKHLSEIYFWWVEASSQGNYLKNEYQQLGKKYKTVVSYGTNYAPLLWLVYGNNSGLNNSHIDRYSRALNAIHKEVSKKTQYYANDSVIKLVNFIKQSGGITALAGYAPPDDDTNSSSTIKNRTALDKLAVQDLLKQSWMLGEYRIDIQPPVEYSSYLNTTHDDFAMVLVKRTKQGFEIVDVESNESVVNPLLANALSKRFDLCVFSIRPLLELIYTQCLPQSLEGLAEKLIDVTTTKDDKLRKKTINHRRVFYRADTKEFILSPMNAITGVVSVIKPYFDLVLDSCDRDVYMPYMERNNIESHLLRNFEFNLYDSEINQPPIPAYSELDSASHVIHLRHRTDNAQFQNISFWPFYSSLEQPQNQLLVKENYQLTPKWYAHIDKDEVKRINYEFLNLWLNGHARYIKREPHAILQFTFASNYIAVEFVLEDGAFVNKQTIEFKSIDVSQNTVICLFRTKDIVPALNCLADLPIIKKSEPTAISDLIANSDKDVSTSPIDGILVADMSEGYRGGLRFDLDDDLLRIHFYTDGLGGTEHTIFVPTANSSGTTSEKPFCSYVPQVTDDTLSDVDTAQVDALPLLVEVL